MSNRKHPAISLHETLNGILEVNWEKDYKGEYSCPNCPQGQITNYARQSSSPHKLRLLCNMCKSETLLSREISAYIFRYLPDIECPNPLCVEIGHDGQKGWIYKIADSKSECRFCGISFNFNSESPGSWMGRQKQDKLLPFNFDEDVWDLRHFYEKPRHQKLDIREVKPQWYRVEVKKYLYFFLKLPTFSSDLSIRDSISTLKYFGCIIEKLNIHKSSDISREMVLAFKDTCMKNANATINRKLKELKDFFEYLELDTSHLIRERDKLKPIRNDPDWLDEVTRQAIHQHLSKIPAPIARHYLIQEYTATRPTDACNITFDCLVEENGKWYVRFSEGKKKRGRQGKENRPKYHQLPATREIRRIIEEQQYWIRETLGAEYSYLLCHFRGVNIRTYPNFPGIKSLPEPPNSNVDSNPMVRIIQMLIEREDIRDANDLKPHFVGKITRSSKLQEIRAEHGMEVAQLYANHARSSTTFQHYAPPTREQIAAVDLPFQELLMNPSNKFLPWQSLPESLLKNPKAHELDSEIAPRLVVYGHCILNPKTPCPVNLYPKCYGCGSFRPSTAKLPLYERQHQGEQLRLREAEQAGAELAAEEAKAIISAMDIWLPELQRLVND